ncbi:helix-turn-helix domain-containing protein [Rhizosphaericola mali]|uniref:Helix-turn-helix domain-containing protein n=1 Tax=Rhizosphaericola mali TaxID=2545455 RepID=A0A5P2G0L3_9BACT|nr:helix-turn-helix domain-containing protein [Rhizosphaericola mali]QES88975.1 helix-turn-helix domain-containing protein [Rhizosphaericola mali]
MENAMTYNPFETILARLDQIQLRLDIISANLPKSKVVEILKDPNDILDTRSIAKVLGTPESTVRGYINEVDKTKALPAYKHGKGYRIRRAKLQQWADEVFLQKVVQPDNTFHPEVSMDDILEEDNGIAPSFMRKVHQRRIEQIYSTKQ